MDSINWSPGLISNLVEVLKTGILLTDNQGWIRFANHLANGLLGYPQDYLNGKSIETLFLPDDARVFLPNILRLTRDNSGFDGEVLLKKKDGDSIFVNCSTALYKDNSTGHELIIFALQDITLFKKMEKKQIESERFVGLGMMTDQISHQIRNPIAAIGGFALRLARDQISPDEYSDYTKIIHNEAKRLEHIIDRLVEFSHVHSDRFFALTLTEVFDGVRKAPQFELEGSSVRLKFPDSATLPVKPLYVDLALIEQALRCIVQNSLEASAKEGEVTVTGDIIGNQVLIGVKDQGEGIQPEHLPFIFDPFFTTKFNRLGLGLTMAQRIVQVHKGYIEVDSVPKEGTKVSIILPLDRRREIRTKLFQKNLHAL
jgi:PAS domain S-box-containing protein